MHRRKATWFEGGIAKLLAYEKLDKSLNRGFLNLLRGPSFVSWKPNFQVLFIIIKVAKWKTFFFFIINKFNLIFLKIHLLILYRIYFSEIRRIIKNILLFVNYIKFGPQYFWLLYIYIYFQFHPLKFDFYINFGPYFFDCYSFFFLILLLIKFFIYHIWSLFFLLLFILFEIIYEIFFFNFIIFFFFIYNTWY
jgi:hypothetical protein